MTFSKFLKTFLPHRMKRQIRELFIATTMVNFALAMVTLFEPIYLYKIGYSLHFIMLFYIITYVLYFVIMPLGAKFAKWKGYENGLLIGTFLYIVFYIGLFFIADYPILFYIVPVIFALQKMFYWPAYHADFARFSNNIEAGREISAITVTSSLVYIIGPAMAGFIIFVWGYGVLFTVASLLFLLSNVFTLMTIEKFEPSEFSYGYTYKNLFSRENRKSFLAYTGFGEELVVMVVWPIFISIIIVNVLDLGIIIALATLITTLIVFYIGKFSDVYNKRYILRLGSAFYSLAWFIRIFITNTIGIFFIDTMSKLGKNVIAVPLTAITYEEAKEVKSDHHKHIMSRIVFFEMSLVVGKIVALLLVFLITLLISDEVFAFRITFVLAGAMSLLYLLL